MNQNRDLSLQLLTDVADSLEASQKERGGFNHLATRFAGNAARLLQFNALERRFKVLLSAVTPDQYWSGMITNIQRTDEVPKGACELDTLPDLERLHPPFTDGYALSVICGDHLSPCLNGDYEAAFADAKTELEREEIALTQALLGDTKLAMGSTSRLLEQQRRDHVLFVVTIELYRRNLLDEAKSVHDRLTPVVLSERGSAQMALGIANRIPWPGYPYPDY